MFYAEERGLDHRDSSGRESQGRKVRELVQQHAAGVGCCVNLRSGLRQHVDRDKHGRWRLGVNRVVYYLGLGTRTGRAHLRGYDQSLYPVVLRLSASERSSQYGELQIKLCWIHGTEYIAPNDERTRCCTEVECLNW